MQVLTRKTLPLFLRSAHLFGNYYQTVKMFADVQETAGNKDKLTKIRQFKNGLSQTDRKEFFNLLQWYSKNESVRISSKIINKYYLNHHVSTAHYTQVEAEVTRDGVMKRLCKEDKQSELTLFDINLFLRYLCSVEGKGSQTDKAKKIIEFGENVSILQGTFFLKLIEKRLTIGASSKTFRKMDAQEQSVDQKPKKQRKPRTKKTDAIEQQVQQVQPQQQGQKEQVQPSTSESTSQSVSEEQIMRRMKQLKIKKPKTK